MKAAITEEPANTGSKDRTPGEVSQWINQLIREEGNLKTVTESGDFKVFGGDTLFIATERTTVVDGPARGKEKVASLIILTNKNHALGSFTASKPKVFANSLEGQAPIDCPFNQIRRIVSFDGTDKVKVEDKAGVQYELTLSFRLTIYS